MFRRPIKDKDIINSWDCESDGTPVAFIDQKTGDHYLPTFPCPYQPGDILYVRETWQEVYETEYMDNGERVNIREAITNWDKICHVCANPNEPQKYYRRYYIFKADTPKFSENDPWSKGLRWRSPVQMPKKAARLFLRVTDVRVERLREISANSVINEGFTDRNDFVRYWNITTKIADFHRYSWHANPWVWVIEFEWVENEKVQNEFT